METPPSRSDSENLDAWESRLARVPLVSLPPELRAACLKAHQPYPTPSDWLGFWRSLWSGHRWAISGLTAAWALIATIQLTTPEISSSLPDSHTVWAEETLKTAARQRAELMATGLDWGLDSAPLPGAFNPPAKTSASPDTAPPTAFRTNRIS
jgi:hypothetical protein